MLRLPCLEEEGKFVLMQDALYEFTSLCLFLDELVTVCYRITGHEICSMPEVG